MLENLEKQPLPSDQLQALRALEVLEHIGSPEACRVPAALADGASEARLTWEAPLALERLSRRAPAGP